MMSSSSMIVMRVLPAQGSTAPRLPCLKSYSLRMVLLRLAVTGLACRDRPDAFPAPGVDDGEHPAQGIHAQRDETLLIHRIRVFDRQCKGIMKRLLCVRKADPVLLLVGSRLVRVELEVHGVVCITYAYVQAGSRERRTNGRAVPLAIRAWCWRASRAYPRWGDRLLLALQLQPSRPHSRPEQFAAPQRQASRPSWCDSP